tara:strand:+ start:624 stop:779 length:156 start_codon:yes stop_codon:yes gene_type:complete
MYRANIMIFIIWLVLVVIWNYGFPLASPAEDVFVAVLLSILSVIMNRLFIK